MKKRKKFPQELLVYVFDTDSETGEPLYAVARNVEEIPEDQQGDRVSIYILNHTLRFKVRRELV